MLHIFLLTPDLFLGGIVREYNSDKRKNISVFKYLLKIIAALVLFCQSSSIYILVSYLRQFNIILAIVQEFNVKLLANPGWLYAHSRTALLTAV